LIKALGDPCEDVRLAAVVAIEQIAPKSDAAATAVARRLDDSNREILLSAVDALGRMRPNSARAVPALMSALHRAGMGTNSSTQLYLQANIARLLGRIGPEARAAVPELIRLVRIGDNYAREQAAVALWRVDRNTNGMALLIADLWKCLSGHAPPYPPPDIARSIALPALAEMGPLAEPAVPVILATIRDSGSFGSPMPAQVLQAALEARDRIAPGASEPTVAQLIANLQIPDSDARIGALRRLAATRVNKDQALDQVIAFVTDTNVQIQIAAVSAVGSFGMVRTQATPALIQVLRKTSHGGAAVGLFPQGLAIRQLQRSAIYELGRMGSAAQAAVPDLTKLVDGEKGHSQHPIVLALWRITQDPNLITREASQLEETSDATEFRIILSILAQIGPAARPAVPAIMAGLTKFGPDLSGAINRALAKIDSGAAERLGGQLKP
jgi:HEAT repeat protein